MGKNVNPVQIESTSNDDIDVLKFCAVMRVFGEWRILRQVPQGYKGYALGMNMGLKDIIQNVAKLEDAAYSWIERRKIEFVDGLSSSDLRSPTIRDLLLYEIEMNVHPNNRLPKLAEKSAAMGILWVARTLEYQTEIFSNVLLVPKKYSTAVEAITEAYMTSFEKYHGWAIQKIFTFSFQAAPKTEDIFKHMNPSRLKEVEEEFYSSSPDCDISGLDTTEKEQLKSSKTSEKNFFKDWIEKILPKNDKDRLQVARYGRSEISIEEQEAYIEREMTRDAHEHIEKYLSIVRPFGKMLSNVILEYNMNDPTVV